MLVNMREVVCLLEVHRWNGDALLCIAWRDVSGRAEVWVGVIVDGSWSVDVHHQWSLVIAVYSQVWRTSCPDCLVKRQALVRPTSFASFPQRQSQAAGHQQQSCQRGGDGNGDHGGLAETIAVTVRTRRSTITTGTAIWSSSYTGERGVDSGRCLRRQIHSC